MKYDSTVAKMHQRNWPRSFCQYWLSGSYLHIIKYGSGFYCSAQFVNHVTGLLLPAETQRLCSHHLPSPSFLPSFSQQSSPICSPLSPEPEGKWQQKIRTFFDWPQIVTARTVEQQFKRLGNFCLGDIQSNTWFRFSILRTRQFKAKQNKTTTNSHQTHPSTWLMKLLLYP